MKAHLQRLEIERAVAGDHDLAVEHAALRQLGLERGDELGEVAVERLLIAALNEHLVAVAEDDRAKAVPFGLEHPLVADGKLAHILGEHGKDWRIDGKLHASAARYGLVDQDSVSFMPTCVASKPSRS